MVYGFTVGKLLKYFSKRLDSRSLQNNIMKSNPTSPTISPFPFRPGSFPKQKPYLTSNTSRISPRSLPSTPLSLLYYGQLLQLLYSNPFSYQSSNHPYLSITSHSTSPSSNHFSKPTNPFLSFPSFHTLPIFGTIL